MNDDIFSYYEEQEDAEMRVFIREGDIVIREENSFDYEIPLSDCTTVTGALNPPKNVDDGRHAVPRYPPDC